MSVRRLQSSVSPQRVTEPEPIDRICCPLARLPPPPAGPLAKVCGMWLRACVILSVTTTSIDSICIAEALKVWHPFLQAVSAVGVCGGGEQNMLVAGLRGGHAALLDVRAGQLLCHWAAHSSMVTAAMCWEHLLVTSSQVQLKTCEHTAF